MKTTSVVLTITALILLVAIPVFQVSAQTVDPEPISGTIQTITPITDPATGEVTIRVALRTDEGVQPLMLTLEDAVALGLVTVTTNVPPVVTVVETMIGQTLTLDPALILELGELVTQPIAIKLGDFLSGILGVDGAALMAFHEQGLGFGEIAQAGFMAMALDGDSSTFTGILDAKKSGDYSAVVLPDGSTPSNWGQLRKAVFTEEKNLKNLGAVISNRAEKESGKQNQNEHGNGKENGEKK
jgi:hypothetical protein